MIINFVIGQIIVGTLTPNIAFLFRFSGITDFFIVFLYILLLTVILVVFHELLHLLFVPNFIKSNKTYI